MASNTRRGYNVTQKYIFTLHVDCRNYLAHTSRELPESYLIGTGLQLLKLIGFNDNIDKGIVTQAKDILKSTNKRARKTCFAFDFLKSALFLLFGWMIRNLLTAKSPP